MSDWRRRRSTGSKTRWAKPQPERSGAGRQIYYFTAGASSKIRPGDLNRKSPYFERGEDRKNSFLVVRVTNNELGVKAIASDGENLDSFEILKK